MLDLLFKQILNQQDSYLHPDAIKDDYSVLREKRSYKKYASSQNCSPGSTLPLKALITCSHFSFDSILANPTPRLTPSGFRRIRVEITVP